jgi:hypothetical protein
VKESAIDDDHAAKNHPCSIFFTIPGVSTWGSLIRELVALCLIAMHQSLEIAKVASFSHNLRCSGQ